MLSLILPRHLHAEAYTVTDLGIKGEISSVASGINSSGHIVGSARFDDGPSRGFLWIEEVRYNLNDLVIPPHPDFSFVGVSIDDLGHIAGEKWIDSSVQGFFLNNDLLLELEPIPGFTDCQPSDLNESGSVVGSSFAFFKGGETSPTGATLWENGIVRDLGVLPPFSDSAASAINAAGQVVGSSQSCFIGDCDAVAVLWDGGAIEGLGTLPGLPNSFAVDINDLGQIACLASNADQSAARAYLLTEKREMIDLGELPGRPATIPHAMNAQGWIVGRSSPTPGGLEKEYRAFLWKDGVMRDLNDLIPANSGWQLRRALDINDAGQIVGEGVLNGNRRAFLLTSVVPTVSEWGLVTMTLLLLTAGTLIARHPA